MPCAWQARSNGCPRHRAVRPERFFGKSANWDAVVGQDNFDLVGNGGCQGIQEGARRYGGGFVREPGKGELRGAVDANVQIQLALRRPHLGDVDMEEADRIGFELLPGRLVALDIWQARDAVALKAAMQGRSRQMRDRRLQAIETVVERQSRMPTKGDDDRLVLARQDRRLRFAWPGRQIGDRGPLLPLRHRLLIDAVALGERPQALYAVSLDGPPLSPWRSRGEPGP